MFYNFTLNVLCNLKFCPLQNYSDCVGSDGQGRNFVLMKFGASIWLLLVDLEIFFAPDDGALPPLLSDSELALWLF